MNKISQININSYYLSPKKISFGKLKVANNPITNPDIQRSSIISQPLKAFTLAFLGKPKEIVTPSILHEKIENQSLGVTTNQVQVMLDNVLKILKEKGINAEQKDVLLTMCVLTQFANLEGIAKLNDVIIRNTNGNYRNYAHAPAVSLGNVLHYLSKYKGLFHYDDTKEKTIFALDTLGLKTLESKLSKNTLEDFKLSSFEFVYPVGWNEGINLFNQQKTYSDFESKVADAISKAYGSGGDFPDALNKVLTHDIEISAKKLGIDNVKFLTTTYENQKITCEDIKNNLNAQIPTRNQVDSICKGIGAYCSKNYGNSEEYWSNLTAKFLYDNLAYYSPKQITEKLKQIYREVEKNIPEDKTMNDVYFLVPQTARSFSYIDYQFALVNGISSDKFVRGDVDIAEMKYDGKIFVYLDDISASGQTTLEELGGLYYNGLSYLDHMNCGKIKLTTNHIKNQYMIATLFTTDKALKRTQNEIDKRIRSNPEGKKIKDVLIVTDTDKLNEVEYSSKELKDLPKIKKLFSDSSHGAGGFRGLETKVIFPYMTPDSNAPILKFLSSKFVPRNAIKTKLDPPERELAISKIISKNIKRV